MTSVNLDQNFKEELQHVDQWFRFLSETERTATIYTLLQHSSQVQLRFFISILQQLMKRDPLYSYLTPANPEQGSSCKGINRISLSLSLYLYCIWFTSLMCQKNLDMQSQLAGAVAKMELEANQRLRAAATIRRPPSAGNDRRNLDNRHSFALGDTEDYSRLFGSMGSNSSSMLNLNGGGGGAGTATSAAGVSTSNSSMMDDFGRAPIPRAPTTRSSLFANRSRPRSVIEGDSSLLFPHATNIGGSSNSNWLQPPRSSLSGGGSRSGSRLSMAAERPKSADVSMWALPSFDHEENRKQRAAAAAAAAAAVGATTNSWGVPSTVQFADLSPRDDWTTTHRRAGRSNNNNNNIPGTVPETDERTSSSAAVDSANLVLSGFNDSHSPVPSVSASAPFNTRRSTHHNHHHHLAPPGMEKHYGQFLNPADATTTAFGGGIDDHDYLSDHSEASNVSADRGGYNKRRGTGLGKSPAPSSSGSRTPKDGSSYNSNKKASETVNLELLEDVPAFFRSLRLHKYNAIFEPMKWQDIVKLSDEDLQAKGVAALGARRKMLKVFENIRAHCDANNIKY
ncbi:hypothetical protein BDB00DRAFT_393100 [Zychaea mexicana]|uniref:uncharacterized protein n=1 Tax=Zychaea mexicana TaxID=64656 RepID=UPI0022FDB516|nr:uncharacterized protein BDB00DRAFT_393100 [Zychaea mexicana]KAI9498619.1 hypothetical protein BDB00DRAFT_393100 [Zychaea mexicana]